MFLTSVDESAYSSVKKVMSHVEKCFEVWTNLDVQTGKIQTRSLSSVCINSV